MFGRLPIVGTTMISVTDRSALVIWGEPGVIRLLGAPAAEPWEWSTASGDVLDEQVLRASRLEATDARPLHVLVDSAAHRIRSARVVCHVWSAPLPAGALYQLTPRVLLASPSFCLQGMAARRDLVEGTVIGMEVCGSYARVPGTEDGFRCRAPLASPDELLKDLAGNHGYGAKRARAALARVVPGSRSPMETVVVLLFTLPVSLGGCGLPAPRLNVRIEIPPDLQAALGKPYVVVDLCWYEQRVILEYDSYRWHTTPSAVDADSSRNEGLRDVGWMVRSVTAGILKNDAMRRHLVGRVMERFGRRLPEGAAFDRLQSDLVRRLLRA